MMESLSYVIPSDLHGELLQYIVTTVNLTPNFVSGTRLPYEIFHRKKPDLSNVALLTFGQPLMVKTHSHLLTKMLPARKIASH